MYSVVFYFNNWKPRLTSWKQDRMDAIYEARGYKRIKPELKIKVFDPNGAQIKF